MLSRWAQKQGCQTVYFQTKNPDLVNFSGPWNGKDRYILEPFGIYYGYFEGTIYGHLVI
jgi:hypothetical protein